MTNSLRRNSRKVPPTLLLTGFEPFGRERINPSWEIARRLSGHSIAGFKITSVKLPVAFSRAQPRMVAAIRKLRPAAVIGLGQAGGRPTISIEQVAINLIDERAKDKSGRLANRDSVVSGGPDAYFTRLPIREIRSALQRRRIPAARSLSAGAFICNAVMYAMLHELRRRREVPAGFIHLPYESRQASLHRETPSMSFDLMAEAVRIAIATLSEQQTKRARRR